MLGKFALVTQIAKFMGPTWGPPGSCRPQMGPMLAPWTLPGSYRVQNGINSWWLLSLCTSLSYQHYRWCGKSSCMVLILQWCIRSEALHAGKVSQLLTKSSSVSICSRKKLLMCIYFVVHLHIFGGAATFLTVLWISLNPNLNVHPGVRVHG